MMVSHACFYCGRELSRQQMTKDHVLPRSKGGSDSKNNKVDCCRRCNEEKGCLELAEFRAVHAFRKGIPVEQFLFPGEIEKFGGAHPSGSTKRIDRPNLINPLELLVVFELSE